MAGFGNHERELIAAYAPEIRPTATGYIDIPAKGLYNPLVPAYTISPFARKGDGGVNINGIGIHPDEGTLRPLGTLAYPHPLWTHRDEERAGPQSDVSSSSDG